MSSALISVIVPVYNVENFINECIYSIINQTYDNLEIILINDGSTDKSGEICEYYAHKDQRVNVFHKKNGGLSDARNMGLDKANGSYISFIDSDDYVHPQFMEILYSNIISQKTDISFCFFTRFHFSISSEVHFLNFKSFFSFDPYVQTVIMCNKLFKTELWKDVRFEIGKYHEDEFIYHKLFFNKSFSYTKSELYHYRKREGSIMGIQSKKRVTDTTEAYNRRYSFFKKENVFYADNILLFVMQLNLDDYYKFGENDSRVFLRKHTLDIFKLDNLNWKEKLYLIKRLWLFN